MTSAGKWVLGLLLLVVGAVFIARTVSSDPGSQAEVKNLPSASPAGAAKDNADAAAAAAKKVASTIAGDVSCKKACIEVNEVANDSVTTAKLAPGSVTLSKLAFEVPNLNELENEINARKAAEAATKAAQAEAAANAAKNDAAITAAASNGITAEAAARTAADEDLAKKTAAADADLLGKLNKEMSDRSAADDVLQGKLNTEIADRAGAISGLRGELANPNQVGAPIIQINNNEVVADAITGDKILNRTIKKDDLAEGAVTTFEILNRTILAEDLSSNSVVGRAAGVTLALRNVMERTLRGERTNNSSAAVSPGDIAVGTITGNRAPNASASAANGNLALETVTGESDNVIRADGLAVGNLGLRTVGRNNLVADAITTDKIAGGAVETSDIAVGNVTFDRLDVPTQTRINNLETGLAQEIVDRTADVDAEEAARIAGDANLQTQLNNEVTNRIADVDAEEAARILDVNTEEAARIAGDASLQTQLNDEIADRLAVDAAQSTALTDEIADREAADTGLATDIATVSSNLATETTNRTNADAGLATDIAIVATDLATETSDRAAEDTAINTRITDLDFADINGVVTAGQLGAGSVVGGPGGTIDDGTITADDLAGEYDTDPAQTEITVGAVTSEKIADGTIQARDLGSGSVTATQLAAGAVTTDKQTANARSAVGAATLAVGETSVDVPLGGTTLTLPSPNHKVMLSGQAVASCTLCTGTSSQTFEWQLFDGATRVGPKYSRTLTSADPFFLSYSGLAAPVAPTGTPPVGGISVPAGDHTYTVKITSTAAAVNEVAVTGIVLNAVDLGKAPLVEAPPVP